MFCPIRSILREVKLTALTSLKDLYMQEFGQNMQQKKVVHSRQQNQAHLKRRKAKMQGQKKRTGNHFHKIYEKSFIKCPMLLHPTVAKTGNLKCAADTHFGT